MAFRRDKVLVGVPDGAGKPAGQNRRPPL